MSEESTAPARWRRLTGAARWSRRRLPGPAGVLLVALVGGGIGAALAPPSSTGVGPLGVQVRVLPSLNPGVRLLLPPAGEVQFRTHHAPVEVQARITQVDPAGARALIESSAQLRALSDTAPRILTWAAVRAALVTICCTLAGALGLALLVYRRRLRYTYQVGGLVLATVAATAALTAVTADPQRLAQPRFTGLLSQAPYIAGKVPNVLARLESYRSGLADIIRSVSAVYATADQLPELSTESGNGVITVLHVSDIHLNPLGHDLISRLTTQFGVDVVIDTGDITTTGTATEGRTVAPIAGLKVPYVYVRGNHDSTITERAVSANRNAIVLDGQVAVVDGLVVAGIGDPAFTPEEPAGTGNDTGAALALQTAANQRLAGVIGRWNAAHPQQPVQVAAVHDPSGLQPLEGLVPLIFAGHTHVRDSYLRGGTRVLIEGSTGGAGITTAGLRRLSDGKPLPLAASLIHIARTGPYAGRVLAIDSITVGGFGLTSVNLQRTVVDPATAPKLVAPPTPAPTPRASGPG